MHVSAVPQFSSKRQSQIAPHVREAFGCLLLNPESVFRGAALTPRS